MTDVRVRLADTLSTRYRIDRELGRGGHFLFVKTPSQQRIVVRLDALDPVRH